MMGASVISGARVMRAPRLKPPSNVSEMSSVCNEPGVAAAEKPSAAPCRKKREKKSKNHVPRSKLHNRRRP
jgi:hypothetical protein